MERNWYPWEFQRIVGRPHFQKEHNYVLCIKKSSIFLISRVLVCTIRMVLTKIVFQMFIEKAAINEIKKPGIITDSIALFNTIFTSLLYKIVDLII